MNAREAYEASMRRLEVRTQEDLERAHTRITEAVDQGLTEVCLFGKVMPSTLEALKKSGYRISGPGDSDTGSVYVRWAHIADEPAQPQTLFEALGSTAMIVEPEVQDEDRYVVMRKLHRRNGISASYWKGGVHWAYQSDEVGVMVMPQKVAEGVCAYMCNGSVQHSLQTAEYQPVRAAHARILPGDAR